MRPRMQMRKVQHQHAPGVSGKGWVEFDPECYRAIQEPRQARLPGKIGVQDEEREEKTSEQTALILQQRPTALFCVAVFPPNETATTENSSYTSELCKAQCQPAQGPCRLEPCRTSTLEDHCQGSHGTQAAEP